MCRVDNHLHDSLSISKIYENNSAMVAATMYPAREGNRFIEKRLVDESAVV
ncbi:hypothetical protein GCM10007161_11340 [Ignatzschineria indica]|nr:hypothetical protein GCM10007161_11340 [Ignatzschineria indica]